MTPGEFALAHFLVSLVVNLIQVIVTLIFTIFVFAVSFISLSLLSIISVISFSWGVGIFFWGWGGWFFLLLFSPFLSRVARRDFSNLTNRLGNSKHVPKSITIFFLSLSLSSSICCACKFMKSPVGW